MTSASCLSISREEIRIAYAQGEEAVIELVETRFNALVARLEALENQLKQDSQNSSKPPSSDGFTKRTKSLRSPSECPSGGQIGHPGSTLEWNSEPTHVEIHPVLSCQGCGKSLVNVPLDSWDNRQVHDLPRVQVEVTQHQCEVKCCPKCGKLSRGNFPSTVKRQVQYGVNVQALTMYLMVVQLIPSLRICELFSEAFGLSLSEGTIYNIRQRCFKGLETSSQQIKSALHLSEVVHYDETGFRVGSKLWWLHVGCTDELTFYFVHTKRGRVAMDAMGLLPGFTGTALHDGLRSYGQYDCLHGLCNAHHLRELRFIVECFKQVWAQEMFDLLTQMNQEVKAAKQEGATALEPARITALEQLYGEILDRGFKANPALLIPENAPKAKGRPKQSKAKNLLDRLKLQQESVLRFIHDFRVPFDNNQAERDIRMMKLKQKISGCFRSESGAQMFCRIRGYVSTVRKQGDSAFNGFIQLFMGHPVSPIPKAE